MRRWRAIAFATALEILSEPLVLLVTLSSMAMAMLAPVLHFHQFGEPSRMARDAGFSALLVGTSIVAVFAAVKSIRREIESGTALSALAHPVSRSQFFLGKISGVAVATVISALSIAATSLIAVKGALIGGEIAAPVGDIPRMWGPSLAFATAAVVLSLVMAAVMNWRFRMRFTPVASLLALLLALSGVLYRLDLAMISRLALAYLLAVVPAMLLMTVAAAAAVRLKANAASAVTLVVTAAFLPALGNYCLSDVMSVGGVVTWRYALAALAAAGVFMLAALLAGIWLFERSELATGE